MTSGDGVKVACPLFRKEGEGANPISPLQLKIVEIGVQRACALNGAWHSHLPQIDWSNVVRNKHYVCYAAEFNYTYYGVAIWSSPVAANRFHSGGEILELRRYAIPLYAPRYTASRMLGVMVRLIRKKFREIRRLISYQEIERHTGTIYKACGWRAVSNTQYLSWTTKKRERNKEQIKSAKIRWEKEL